MNYLYFKNLDEIQDIIQDEPGLFYDLILASVYEAILTRKVKAKCIPIFIEDDPNEEFIMCIKKENYKGMLEEILPYYVALEEFEICGHMKTIIDKL